MASSDRRLLRERALSLSYEAEIKNTTAETILASLPILEDKMVVSLLLEDEMHRVESDRLIEEASRSWHTERMPVIDLCILRLAISELIGSAETPFAVVISEAVELAKRFSTDASSKFINGVLSTVQARLALSDSQEPHVEGELSAGEEN